MQTKEKLIAFSKYLACPYILDIDVIKPHTKNLSMILVGSAATGLFEENSNIDICMLCKKNVAKAINREINWTGNQCTELIIGGLNVRYYIETIEDILEGLEKMDDRMFYLYTNAVALDDVSGAYKNLQKYILEEELTSKRKKYSYNILKKKYKTLSVVLDEIDDPFARVNAANDVLKALLRAIAVNDAVPFSIKKYPYKTALCGSSGARLKTYVDEAISLLCSLSDICNSAQSARFKELIALCTEHLN